jgi:PAS domain S-box-containing protein
MTLYDIVAHDRESIDENVRRILGRGHYFLGERQYRRADGALVDVEVVVSAISYRGVDALCIVAHDVTERKQNEDSQRFLVEAGMVLASSLDYQTTLASVARMAVPGLADWCAVDMVGENGEIQRLAVAHQDPEKGRWARELQERFAPDPNARQGVPQVLRSGRTEFYPEITDELLEAATNNEDQLRIIREIGFTSVIITPLIARGQTLGTITLASSESGRIYGEKDLNLAEELARRAALAVDNARLFEEARAEISERRRAEVDLKESEERYRAVIEQSTEGIYLFDSDTGAIVESNPALQEMLGYTDTELAGMEVYELVDLSREEIDSNIQRTLEEGRRFVGERKYRSKDGSEVAVEIGLSLIHYRGKEIICATVHDISERKKAEQALQEIREEERNRIARDLHDDILQNMVYALQEIQILQITSEDGGEPGLEDTAEALRRSVEGLRVAIFELRLDATLDRSLSFSLNALLETNRRMSRRRFDIEMAVSEDFPQMLPDKTGRELVRVIQEALNNARRHASPRHVRIELGLDGDLAWVEVVDDGKGFIPSQSQGGVGMSSMGQRAADLGGELKIESEPGEGTRVRFEVPVSRLTGE